MGIDEKAVYLGDPNSDVIVEVVLVTMSTNPYGSVTWWNFQNVPYVTWYSIYNTNDTCDKLISSAGNSVGCSN